MKIEWVTNVNICGDYGKFYEFQELIYFPCNFRRNNHKNFISVYRFDKDGNFKNEVFCYETNDLVASGQDWRIFTNNRKLYLSCGRDRKIINECRFCRDQNGLLHKEFHQEEKTQVDLFLDITEGIIQIEPTAFMLQNYRCHSTVIDEYKSISFGDYQLVLYGNCGYQCIRKKDEKVLWKNKHQGYRYTDFELKNDILFFGTAGFGGKLYGYNLYSGEVICSINTHGTTDYAWHNDRIICRGEDGSLIFVDPYKNNIVNSIKLRGQIPPQSTFSIVNNRLYTLTTDIKAGLSFVNCFDLE